MNHFLLPDGDAGDARFGVHAMDCLIGVLMKLGADRRRFVAKVFGGGHVLDDAAATVPEQNIAFVRRFLADDGLRVASEDVGGREARLVRFHTDSGRAFVKRVTNDHARGHVRRQQAVEIARPEIFGDVTLF